ncbi:MAG TPA: serine hydrolase domain-containing protein [Acidobacteriota bacterium]|nr:serine hydrolase domain-containing protein [Acidobacteriota bacterium]
MKNRTRSGEVLVMALMMISVSLPGGGDSRAKRVEAVFAGMASDREPGAAVLVLENGRVAFERGYGVADLRTMRPIDELTNFRLASVTKQFTAAAVCLLVRDGKLRYDDRLTSVFPDFPAYGRDITIRHLLQHTSGLPDYESLMTAPDPGVPVEEAQIKDAEVLGLLERQTAGKFSPGTKWEYSNSGYVVLGLVVEKVSGLPFGRFLGERLFAPLKMDGTVAYERGKNEVRDRALGHSFEKGRWRETDQSPTSATLGDGGVYSSLRDMARWDAALREHSLLSASELELAMTPVVAPAGPPIEPDGTPAAYGFGWFLNPWKGHARAWHYGETVGFRTAIERFVKDGVTVVVLSNRGDAAAAALALKAAEPYLK